MTDPAYDPRPRRQTSGGGEGPPEGRLIAAAHRGDIDAVAAALNDGANVNAVEAGTGLTALHIAIGTNNLPLTRFLVETWHAAVGPDRRGRWPSVIAARCRVDEVLCDYVVEAEAKAVA